MALNPVAVKIDKSTYEELGKIAAERNCSVHRLMVDAIRRYAQVESKKEAFRLATLQAWEEYAQTGLHATSSEVSDWLNSIGTEEEKAVPVCHL